MPPSNTDIPKKRGPKFKGGKGFGVMVRLKPDSLATLDTWIAHQPDAPSRPEAIRRLIEKSLKTACD